MKIQLEIINHPSDKQFPAGAILRLEHEDRIYQATGVPNYKTGDTKLEPRHLSRLFKDMSILLEHDGYIKKK